MVLPPQVPRGHPGASCLPSGRMCAARASQHHASSPSGQQVVRLSRCSCNRCSSSRRNSWLTRSVRRVVAADVTTGAERRQGVDRRGDRAATRRCGRAPAAAAGPRTRRRAGPPAQFHSRVRISAGNTFSATRRRIARTSGTKSSRSRRPPIGISASMYGRPVRHRRRAAPTSAAPELPCLCPALVVGDVRVRVRQPTCLPSGRRAASVSKNVRREPYHLAGDPGGDGVGVLSDEDDVDVADVIQFLRTAFAHRDDAPVGVRSYRRIPWRPRLPARPPVPPRRPDRPDAHRSWRTAAPFVLPVGATSRAASTISRSPVEPAHMAAPPATGYQSALREQRFQPAVPTAGPMLPPAAAEVRMRDEVIAECQRRSQHRTTGRAALSMSAAGRPTRPSRRPARRPAGPWCAVRRRRPAAGTATTTVRHARRCSSPAVPGGRGGRPVRCRPRTDGTPRPGLGTAGSGHHCRGFRRPVQRCARSPPVCVGTARQIGRVGQSDRYSLSSYGVTWLR